MSGLPRKAYLITLNQKNLCVIYTSGAFANLIMDDMRGAHFEQIFGMEISQSTEKLEEQYEKEYRWNYIEIDSLLPADAEARCLRIMAKAAEEL